MAKDIPIIDVTVSHDGKCVSFFCPYCKRWHVHGNVGCESEGNHRVAHCSNKDSPYLGTGYYLRYASTATGEEVAVNEPKMG